MKFTSVGRSLASWFSWTSSLMLPTSSVFSISTPFAVYRRSKSLSLAFLPNRWLLFIELAASVGDGLRLEAHKYRVRVARIKQVAVEPICIAHNRLAQSVFCPTYVLVIYRRRLKVHWLSFRWPSQRTAKNCSSLGDKGPMKNAYAWARDQNWHNCFRTIWNLRFTSTTADWQPCDKLVSSTDMKKAVAGPFDGTTCAEACASEKQLAIT